MASFVLWLLVGGILGHFVAVRCLNCCDNTKNCANQVRKVSTTATFPCGANKNFYSGYCLDKCPTALYGENGKCTNCYKPCASCTDHGCLSCNGAKFLSKNGLCEDKCYSPALMKNSTTSQTRLVEGKTNLEGVVEVYYDGSWGTVCGDSWDMNAAKVLCKELGLGGVVEPKIVGQARFPSHDGYKDTNIWLSGIKCSGHERSIVDCEHDEWRENDCSHLEDIAVRCTGPELTKTCETSCGDGYFVSNGQCLECPRDCKTCNALDKCLSCHKARFLEGSSCVSRCKRGTYGDKKTMRCEPCSDRCDSCKEPNHCTSCSTKKSTKYLNGGVCVSECTGAVAFSKYLRLSGNFSTPYKGLLEVRYDGAWHTVCDDRFYMATARVFCRELGYGEPIKYGGDLFGQGTGKILNSNVFCRGNEESFIDCPQSPWFYAVCWHSEDIGLHCKPPPDGFDVANKCIEKCPRGMYLSEDGVCELCHRECLSCTKKPDQCLTCREPLYFNGTTCTRICPPGTFGNTTHHTCQACGPKCMSCENHADKCTSCVPPLLHNGTHCGTTCPDKMFRKERVCVSDCGLRHYSKDKACHACPTKCLLCDSATTCKACDHGFVLTKEGKCEVNCSVGQFQAPIDLAKIGVELSLRLRSLEGSKTKGRLEIKHEGHWGSICDDRWDKEEADVACRQLMLGPPVTILYSRAKNFQELNISTILLDDVACKGHEENLGECKSLGWGTHNCGHSENVHIECKGPGAIACQSECPLAHYKSAFMCLPCATGCVNCTGTSTNCSSCGPGFFKANGTCVQKCPLGFYESKRRHCEPCHQSCWTCKGPKETDCTSCKRPSVLLKVMCVQSCTKGYFERGVDSVIQLQYKKGPYDGVVMVSRLGKQGFVCNRYPLIEDGHVVCKQLHMGKALRVYERAVIGDRRPILLQNTRCRGNESSIFECEQSRFRYCSRYNILSVECSGPDLSSQCIDSCPTEKGFYVDGNVCLACSTNCLRCKKNATICTACPEGYLLTWDNKCVEYCPEGTYYNKYGSKTCEQCNPKCVACLKHKDVCTVCTSDKIVGEGGCRSDCTGDGYKRLGSDEIRLSAGRNSSNGVVEIFEKGTWARICGADWSIRHVAVVCHELGLGDPTTVPRYRYLSVYRRTDLPKFNCTGTEWSLKECPRIGTCHRSVVAHVRCNRSSPVKKCVKSCGAGFYLSADSTECLPCALVCATCSGAARQCTSCNPEHALHASRCVKQCPDGYYVHVEKKTCERCSLRCKTCHDGKTNDRCLSCDEPYFLKGTSCVDECYPDYTLEYLMKGNPSNKVRLMNGDSANKGQIRILRNNEWAVLCYPVNSYIANLVCQNLDYKSGSVTAYQHRYNDLGYGNTTELTATCQGFEKAVSDCTIRERSTGCMVPILTCSTKPLDKRLCRKEIKEPCDRQSCFRSHHKSTTCVDGDDVVLPIGHSYCRHCPPNYYGDGINCTMMARTPLKVPRTYQKHTVRLRYTYHFRCYALSEGTAVYASRFDWYKDGKRMDIPRSMFVSGRLQLTRIHYRDAGIYRCVLRNSQGSVSMTFNLTVVGRPLITAPVFVDVVQKHSAVIPCDVLANPPAEIAWRFNNVSIDVNNTRDGGARMLENGSLALDQVIPSDAGNYTCIARNAIGPTMRTIQLRIGEELRFERKANEILVAARDEATFTCRPHSAGRQFSIKWRRNGQTLISGHKYEVGSESLTIKTVTSDDCGQYLCVARDGQSIITSIGTLTIKNEAPCIHTPPQHLSLEDGMYARFYCAANGDPAPSIFWQDKKQPNPNVFEINKVNISHVGVYTCTARSGGKVSKAYAFLTVDGHHPCPLITDAPKDKPAVFGKQAKFHCDGVADSDYIISWYHGGKKLKKNAKYSFSDKQRTLVINNVNEEDVGKYKCTMKGTYGEQSVTAALTSASTGASKGDSSPNTTGIVLGVIVCLIVIIIILYFVHRYRRHGATPVDVLKDVKRKTFSRMQSPTRHTVLQYDKEEYADDDNDMYDNSDTNPFVRD